jgi:hypothetical protein
MSAKATLAQQRQCEVHITSLRREGVLLEEKYRRFDITCTPWSDTMSSAASMDQQPEFRWQMRPCLIDFTLPSIFVPKPFTLLSTLSTTTSLAATCTSTIISSLDVLLWIGQV